MTAPVTGPPVRGRVAADGYLIDPAVIGERAARARVIATWERGSHLYALPDGAWLLSLPGTGSIRAEHAPGLPFRIGSDGRGAVWRHGRPLLVDLLALPRVDVSGWVDLGDLPVHLLSLPQRARGQVVVPEPPAPPLTTLRGAARVGDGREAQRVTWMLAAREAAASRRTGWQWPVWGRARWGRAGRGGAAGRQGREPAHEPWSPFAGLTAWAMGGPAGVLFRSRHERYVRSLAEDFGHARFDEALRRAIALGGTGGRLSVRLPLPRRGRLTPTARMLGAGRVVPSSVTVQDYLRALYVDAAEDLERLGRIEEAAFVRSDLLGNVWDAVLLLERHHRYALAAEVAEGRRLEPAVAIRLWWRAGRRDRAVDLARLRGGFADAVKHLAGSDPDAARSLRTEWVQRLLDGGDLQAAVDAAWVDPTLRPLVLPHLPAGIAVGGPGGTRLLAHLVTHRPTVAAVDAALGLLAGDAVELAAARGSFVTALGDLRCDDPVVDRRLASEALRLLTREPTLLAHSPERTVRRVVLGLRKRADHLLAADAPPTTFDRLPVPSFPVEIEAHATPGHRQVRDAVLLPAGVLVGLGDSGARLLTREGRVRARWDVRADRLVVADHGRTVLLLGRGETTVDIHHLDLATRRARHRAHLSAQRIVGSFDGAVLILEDDHGLAFLDITAPRPRLLWRELGPEIAVHSLARGPGWLSALVQGAVVSVDGVPQLWSWSLPDLTLRHREPVRITAPNAPGQLRGVAAAAGTGLLTLHDTGSGPLLTLYRNAGRKFGRVTDPRAVGVLAAGPLHAVLRSEEDRPMAAPTAGRDLTVDLLGLTSDADPTWPGTTARIRFAGAAAVALRHHDGVVTAHDGTGRIVAVDPRDGRIVANLSLRE